MDAATYELEVEYNSAADYHSELWASERESMRNEGFYSELADLDRQLELDEISAASHLIQSRRIQAAMEAANPAPRKSDQQIADEVVDAMFAPGGKFHHRMANEDNAPEAA